MKKKIKVVNIGIFHEKAKKNKESREKQGQEKCVCVCERERDSCFTATKQLKLIEAKPVPSIDA